MTSPLPPLVQALSGAFGSASANILTYPLDLVTTRLQLEQSTDRKKHGILGGLRLIQSILHKNGPDALYHGLATDTGATFLSNFFYFYIYSWIRRKFTLHAGKILLPRNSSNQNNYQPNLMQELLLGFLAGIASRAISNPLNLLTLKQQTQSTDDSPESRSKGKGIKAEIASIYRQHGLAGFWKGFQMTILLCMNPSITMAFFQLFRRALDAMSSVSFSSAVKDAAKGTTPAKALPPQQAFLIGAISSSIASFILYPLILAKTRLQATSATTIYEVIENTYRKSSEKSASSSDAVPPTAAGISGLYQGLEMQLLKGFLSQGVTFLVKGRIEQAVVAAYRYRRPA